MGEMRMLGACARARWCAGALLVLAAGCGGDDDAMHGDTPDGPDDADGDRSSNGVIAVDEQALRGEAHDGRIELDIPVRAVTASGGASGTLDVSLRSVDGEHRLGSASVPYALSAGESATLHARLPMPGGVADEADLVEFNVRVAQTGPRPIQVTRSLLHVLPVYEVRVEGPSKLRADKLATYRAQVQDPRTRAPRQDETVELVLRQGGEIVRTLTEVTDEAGVAVFEVEVDDAGDYEVEARAATQGTSVTLTHAITVEQPGEKLLLTTDKPIYQPGQTIHLRALALQNPGNQPLAEREVVFEVEDGKGNKIMKRTLQTDDHGIASTRFAIGQVVNMGTFKVRATAGTVIGERTVEVSRYALPKFDVDLAVDRGFYTPGQVVTGTLSARYFFGKDVAGAHVAIEALALDVGENVFERVMGMTDASGRMDFSVQLPATLAGIPLQDGNALVTVRAVVTDTADQEVQKERALTVAPSAVRLALVPESTALVPGIENRLHLFATDPLGGPIAGAEVEVSPAGGTPVTGETDPFGHVEVRWTPDANATRVQVALRAADLPEVREQFDFSSQVGGEHVLVRTDKSIYAIGENVRVELFTSAGESVVYVDWLNEGQAVDMRTLEIEGGRASFDMALDTSLLGDNRIEAYVVDVDGNIVRAGRSIVVKGDASLEVSLTTDKDVYAPGEPAELTFTVVDEQGEPAVAALGVQIVDEAVFSLIDARPGLLKTYFELEDAFAEPQYEIKGPIASFEQLLFTDTARNADAETAEAAQLRAEGSLAALTGRAMMGLSQSSWPLTVAAARLKLADPLRAEKERLLALLGPLATAELKELVASGCKTDEYYCESAGTTLGEALALRVRGKLRAYDLWGSAYSDSAVPGSPALRLASAGPDEVVGNLDDEAIEVRLGELDLVDDSHGASDAGAAIDFDNNGAFRGGQNPEFGAAGGGGMAAPVPATPVQDDPSTAEPDATASPRVRREFPETLYVNPAIITDADGTATIAIDMADSITEWRVSALANARSGKLGGGESGITVFQDFFTDVNFPAELTRGDEVEFPIVVYNYLTEAQSVRLELEPADWYTALGSTELVLDLAPGEVRATRLPVRVERVGVQTLTVRAFGAGASDAVARMVRVVPDGQAVPLAQSGSLGAGDLLLPVDFPIDAVPGSEQLYLEVYPAFLSHAVSGLDSLLQVPDGCFEQTTSTTWPNVLVTHYLEQTGQTTPEIQLKTESLISAGYQRLLTFEHPNGGFSWFGTQDPAPFLSVTAFGLMEFVDMAAVHEVDADMIARTQAWLVSQQQADGSWTGDMSEFFTFHTSSVRNTAFVAWALAQNGFTGAEMDSALAYLKANLAANETDAYTIALVANAFAQAAPGDSFGAGLLEQLDAGKHVDGDKASWDTGDTQTNFYGGGDDAAIATTALVAHAMLTAGGYGATVNAALNYLVGSKDALGNFGSTQSTVWTLKTLLLSALRGTESAIGTLQVTLDGAPFASVELTEEQADVMTTVDMSELATTGAHAVGLGFSGEGKVSYNLVSKHHVPWQPGQPSTGPLAITVAYDRTSLVVDETVTATLTVANQTASQQSMILVTAGIPPGFEVLSEDLDGHVQEGRMSHWEKTGKQLILYLTELAASESRAFDYRLRATMPVRAVDGGAEAYLYYEPEQRAQSAGQMLAASAE